VNDFLLTLQARAAREFGVPWGVFDSLTPTELAAIAADEKKNWIAEQKLQDARIAKLGSAIYGAQGVKVNPEDFMVDYEGESQSEALVESDDALRAKLFMWAAFTNKSNGS